jgi:hypothetical protein
MICDYLHDFVGDDFLRKSQTYCEVGTENHRAFRKLAGLQIIYFNNLRGIVFMKMKKLKLVITISVAIGMLGIVQNVAAETVSKPPVKVVNDTGQSVNDFHIQTNLLKGYDFKFPTIENGGTYTLPVGYSVGFGSVAGDSLRLITAAYWTFDGKKVGDYAFPEESILTVPEPEEWAMMLLGLPLMGFVARHKKSDNNFNFVNAVVA